MMRHRYVTRGVFALILGLIVIASQGGLAWKTAGPVRLAKGTVISRWFNEMEVQQLRTGQPPSAPLVSGMGQP